MGGADAYRPGGSYDPYKKESIFAEKTTEKAPVEKAEKKKKKKHQKKKKESSSSDEDSSDEDKSSDENDEEEEEKPKRFKKKKQGNGLSKPPKKGEKAHPQEVKQIEKPGFSQPQAPRQETLIDLFDPMSANPQ